MSKKASDRISEIQSRIKNERASLSHLNGKISDRYLKQQLTTASHLLNFVESFFLSSEILGRPRSAAEWAYWLDGANLPVQNAIQLREYVEEVIRKFGADARSFPT